MLTSVVRIPNCDIEAREMIIIIAQYLVAFYNQTASRAIVLTCVS